MKAKKSLGQHFLTSEKALSQIVDAADPSPDDVILEIGPGKGVLTKSLLQFTGKVVAVEKDRDMVEILKSEFEEEIKNGGLELLKQDILKFDPEILRSYKDLRFKIVANIPYYITGAIIEKFLSAQYLPERMVLLMQKEVAERIVARDKKESILSMAVKAYGNPKIISKVPRGAFSPAPSVDSAILLIENISRDFFNGSDEKTFFGVLKSTFGKKRKQLGGSLAEYLENKELAQTILAKLSIDTRTRPEDLRLEEWKSLAILVAKHKNGVQ